METIETRQKVSREREFLWMQTHRLEIESKYEGQWIVIEGDRLVAFSREIDDLKNQIKASGIAVPFVVFVPEKINGPTLNIL